MTVKIGVRIGRAAHLISRLIPSRSRHRGIERVDLSIITCGIIVISTVIVNTPTVIRIIGKRAETIILKHIIAAACTHRAGVLHIIYVAAAGRKAIDFHIDVVDQCIVNERRIVPIRRRLIIVQLGGAEVVGDGLSVIVDVQNRGAVTLDPDGGTVRNRLIRLAAVKPEIEIVFVVLRDVHGGVVVGTGLADANNAAGRGAGHGTAAEVVVILLTVVVGVIIGGSLFPVDDSIAGGGKVPLGVNRGILSQLLVEVKRRRHVRVFIPADEGIAVTGIIGGEGGLRGGCAIGDKFGGNIFGGGVILKAELFAVFRNVIVEAQPVAFLHVGIEVHVLGNVLGGVDRPLDGTGVLLIGGERAVNVAETVDHILLDPTGEVLVRLHRGIILGDGHRDRVGTCGNLMVFGGGHSAGLVVVGDVDDVIDRSVQDDLFIRTGGRILVAVIIDLLDGVFRGIRVVGEAGIKDNVFALKHPALEGLGGGNVGHAGVRNGGLARAKLIGAKNLLVDDLPGAL